MDLFLDSLIDRLLSISRAQAEDLTRHVPEIEVGILCYTAREIFMAQPPMIEVSPPLKVAGDTHGQFSDLLRILKKCGLPPTKRYLFLGDYVDRGRQSLETICLLLAYKCKYPKDFFLLRGNHECQNVNRVYGFYDECKRRYSSARLWMTFQDVFNCLPFTALIGGRILCMHGGLSPELVPGELGQLRAVTRPIEPPDPGLLIDLIWADPDPQVKGYQQNTRGISWVFGADVVNDFCRVSNLDLIARAHQVVQDGYEFFAGRKCVTIFSAPHYCGEFDNSAGVMTVEPDLRCSFEIFMLPGGYATVSVGGDKTIVEEPEPADISYGGDRDDDDDEDAVDEIEQDNEAVEMQDEPAAPKAKPEPPKPKPEPPKPKETATSKPEMKVTQANPSKLPTNTTQTKK